MMMERAVVATGAAGAGDVVHVGVKRSIEPPQDPESTATAAIALFANSERPAEMERHGSDRALAHLSVDQSAVAHATADAHTLRVRAARLDSWR